MNTIDRGNQRRHCDVWEPGKLWSLWVVLKEKASAFVDLGRFLDNLTVVFDWDEMCPVDPDTNVRKLNANGEIAVRTELRKMTDFADRLNLPISRAVLGV